MKASINAYNIIKKFEGCRLTAYRDSVGVLTIGYGSTTGVLPGQTITQAQADEKLKQDVYTCEWQINALNLNINQNQYDALISFVFNLGIGNLKSSTLLRLIRAGDFKNAANEFGKWIKAGGKTLPGLVKRRSAERELFVS